MIVTAYTRLVMDCHREEIGNRLDIRTGGFFRAKRNPILPESYRDEPLQPVRLAQPLSVGREALDLTAGEIRGAA